MGRGSGHWDDCARGRAHVLRAASLDAGELDAGPTRTICSSTVAGPSCTAGITTRVTISSSATSMGAATIVRIPSQSTTPGLGSPTTAKAAHEGQILWRTPAFRRHSSLATTGSSPDFFCSRACTTERFTDRTNLDVGAPIAYTFNNRVPTSITQFVDVLNENYGVTPDLGLFFQDQWLVHDGLTLNLGLRYDFIRGTVPAIDRPAGYLVGAASFESVDCVPCWHDLSPRLGVAWIRSRMARPQSRPV